MNTYQCIATLQGHKGFISSVQFKNDGSQIVSGGSDNTIMIWDANKYKCLATLQGHSE